MLMLSLTDTNRYVLRTKHGRTVPRQAAVQMLARLHFSQTNTNLIKKMTASALAPALENVSRGERGRGGKGECARMSDRRQRRWHRVRMTSAIRANEKQWIEKMMPRCAGTWFIFAFLITRNRRSSTAADLGHGRLAMIDSVSSARRTSSNETDRIRFRMGSIGFSSIVHNAATRGLLSRVFARLFNFNRHNVTLLFY